MASLDDGPTVGTAGKSGAAIAVSKTGSATGVATGVTGARAGCKAAKLQGRCRRHVHSKCHSCHGRHSRCRHRSPSGCHRRRQFLHSHRCREHQGRKRRRLQTHIHTNRHGCHGRKDQRRHRPHHGNSKPRIRSRRDSGKHHPSCTQGKPGQGAL